VTAEVVVIIEEQDARTVARLLAEEVRGGEPTDAAAHHDQIVCLTRISDDAGLLPKRAVPQRMCQLPRAVVAAAHAGESRWIVRRAILREQRCSLQRPAAGSEPRTGQPATEANHDPVQHIATADGPIQPEMPVFAIHKNSLEITCNCCCSMGEWPHADTPYHDYCINLRLSRPRPYALRLAPVWR